MSQPATGQPPEPPHRFSDTFQPTAQADADVRLMVQVLDLQDSALSIRRLRDWALAAVALQSGEIHTARKDTTKAVEWFERALAIRERAKAAPEQVASSQFALAVALWDAGSDRTRAVELAKSAAATQRMLGADAAEALATTEAWLAQRR